MRRLIVPIAIALSAMFIAACGSEGISVTSADSEEGAEIFAANCAGCHTLTPAGSQGSGNRALRAQGPNLDQRKLAYEDALYAINNGGASGAVMPQNIVTGEDAEKVAQFIADYSGTEVEDTPRPSPEENFGEPAEAPTNADGDDQS